MKIYKYKKLFIAGLLATAAVSGYATSNNKSELYKGAGVDSLSFEFLGFKATPDVSHHTELTYNDEYDDRLSLNFQADHKMSETVANSFIADHRDSGILNSSASEFPAKEMWQYYYGNLYINGKKVISPFYLGNNKESETENWFSALNLTSYYPLFKSTKYLPLPFSGEQATLGSLYCARYSGGSKHNNFTIQRCGDDSQVEFKMKDDVTSLSFDLSSDTYNIAVPVQAAYYNDLTENYIHGDTLTLLFNVEHHNDKTVATNFINHVGNAVNMFGINEPVITPETLHFYAQGEFTINGSPVVNTVYLAQGDNGNGDNWWFGTPESESNNGKLKVYTQDNHQYCLSQGGDFSDPFDFENYGYKSNVFDVGSCDDGSGDGGTKAHDNVLKLYPGSGVKTLSYNLEGYRVADGQPHQDDLTTNKMIDGHLELNYEAGRHNSNPVYDEFISAVGNYAWFTRESSMYLYNEMLDFYINGELKINGSNVINQVYLAMDDSTGWKFGSKDAWQDDPESGYRGNLWVKTQDNHNYCISQGNEKDKSFMISDQCPDVDAALHSNEFDFNMGEGVYSVKFDMDFGNNEVTPNQPHADMLYVNKMIDDDTLKLIFDSGQSSSKDLANKFMSYSDFNNYQMLNTNSADNKQTHPVTLEFYYYGNLFINGYKSKDLFYIGMEKDNTGHHSYWISTPNSFQISHEEQNLAFYTINHQCYTLRNYGEEDKLHELKVKGCYVDQN